MSLDEAPRRLHPGTVLISLVKGAPSTLLALPAILAVSSRGNVALAIGIALIATLIAAVFRYIAWLRFTYGIAGDALVIESGLLARNRRTIPFDRVQDVDIEQQLLARVFGLAKVKLETGGSGKNEAALDSVSVAEAERLRGVIRGRSVVMERGAEEVADEREPVLFAMTLPRVLLWGLFNFSLVWLAVIFGALQYLDNLLPFEVWNPENWIAIERRAEASGRLTLATGVVLAILFAIAGVLAGVLRTVTRDYGFTLTDEDGRYRRRRGLLTRTEAVVSLKRVQLAVIESGLVRRALGWFGLRLQTLGGSDDKGGRQEVVPFGREAEIGRVLRPLGLERPDAQDLTTVSHSHVVRILLRTVAFPLVLLSVGSFFFSVLLLVIPLLLVPFVVALLEKRYHRYALPGSTLFVQRGVTRRKLWLVPARSVQVVSIRRSWLQRRLGTATLLPDTAGGSALSGPAIVDISVEGAWQLAGLIRQRRSP
jgi:putative membrane protein